MESSPLLLRSKYDGPARTNAKFADRHEQTLKYVRRTFAAQTQVNALDPKVLKDRVKMEARVGIEPAYTELQSAA